MPGNWLSHFNTLNTPAQDGRREERLWISYMFIKEEFGKQNLASKGRAADSRWARVSSFHTYYLDFPPKLDRIPKRWWGEVSFRNPDDSISRVSSWSWWIQRKGLETVRKGGLLYQGEGRKLSQRLERGSRKSVQVSKSGKRTRYCILKIRPKHSMPPE